MTKILLLAAVSLFSFMTVHAKEVAAVAISAQEAKGVTFSKKNGTLMIHTTENKSCVLATDAIAYEPYVSPDASWIAVETELLSNLQILRVYYKAANGCYTELLPSFSTTVWNDLLKRKGLRLEDVIHPRINFLEWRDGHRIKIHISGDLIKDSIDTEITYELKPVDTTNRSVEIKNR